MAIYYILYLLSRFRIQVNKYALVYCELPQKVAQTEIPAMRTTPIQIRVDMRPFLKQKVEMPITQRTHHRLLVKDLLPAQNQFVLLFPYLMPL